MQLSGKAGAWPAGALLWSEVVAPPASTHGSPPQAWGKEAWELTSRKASPQPPFSPRPQSIPTPPPRRQWTGHHTRPGEMDGEPIRTSSQPPQELPRPWAKSSQTSKGIRAGSCNQGGGHTPGGPDWPPILEVSVEEKVEVKGDGRRSPWVLTPAPMWDSPGS